MEKKQGRREAGVRREEGRKKRGVEHDIKGERGRVWVVAMCPNEKWILKWLKKVRKWWHL